MPNSLGAVPYFDQYFGIWMMHEPAFWAQFNMIRKADLHLHLESRAAMVAASPSARGAPLMSGDVAIVSLSGKLMKQESSMGGGTSTVAARRQIRALMRDSQVSAVMFHIDSPGGTVAGTQELADDIAKLTSVKPTAAYFDDLAASAAYWAGSQVGFISASRSTMAGSIGTYTVVYDQSGAAAMEGVKAYVVRAGQYKGMGTPGTEVTPEQLMEIQRNVDSLNAHFLEGVAAGRKMTREQVASLADGRVHVGAEAQKLGLIDAVESFDAAMSRLQKQTIKPRSKSMATADIVVPESSAAPIVATLAEQSPPVSPPEKKEQAAGYEQLKAACYGADATFICAQLEAKATVAQAQTAWMMAQQQRLVEANMKTEQAKAAAAKPGVAAVASSGKKDEAATASDSESFWTLVADQQKAGRSKSEAIQRVIATHPEAHKAMLAEVNANRGK